MAGPALLASTRACGEPSTSPSRALALVLLLLMAILTLLLHARAADECSIWPSDSTQAPIGFEQQECKRCLQTHGILVTSHTEVEIISNRNWSLEEKELPQDICKLWSESSTMGSVSPRAFAHSPCLRRIFLKNYDITRLIEDAFIKNSELIQLQLRKNKLLLPRNDVYIVSPTLRILDLSYNNISTVYNRTFKAIPNISILLLRGNKIRVLNYETFDSLSRLEFLDVSENSLSTIDFAQKLNVNCLYAWKNPLHNIFSSLMKFRMNVTLMFSQDLCCCNVKYCIHSVSQWISKCENCNTKLTSLTPTILEDSTEFTTNTIINYDDNTEAPLSSANLAQKSIETNHFSVVPSAEQGSKKQTQVANITVIVLSTVFSFLILVQSTIIVFLLIKSKRKVIPHVMYWEVKDKGIVIPSVIYGKSEQVTDLDEETYSQLTLNPVYETIPE